MSQSTPIPSKTRRRRRWRLGLLLSLLAVVVGLGMYYRHLTSSRRISRLAAGVLAEWSGAQVEVRAARFSLNGPLVLYGVDVRVPGVPGHADRLFTADQVLIEHNVRALLAGRVEPRRVVLVRPVLYVSEDQATGRLHLQSLASAGRAAAAGGPGLPDIYLHDGQVVFGEFDAARYHRRGALAVTASLTPTPHRRDSYGFVVTSTATDQARMPILDGTLDLHPLKVAGRLQHFSFDSLEWRLLPSTVRQWWQRYEPAGSLPTVQFAYAPGAEPGFTAIIEARRAAITLPYGQFESRMEVDAGRFELAGESVRIRGLTGTIEGLRYALDGQVDGLSAEAPFRLEARIEGALPSQPRYLPALPPDLVRLHEEFSPSGRFAAQGVVERVTAKGPIRNHGTVQVLDGRACCAAFPYPLDDIRGPIQFDDHGLRLALRAAGPTGGRLEITGTVGAGAAGGYDVTVAGRDVPLDDAVYRALNTDQKETLDAVMDRELWDRLEAIGVLNDPAGGPAPRLALGGRVSFTARIRGAAGSGVPDIESFEADLAGMNLLATPWPYPLRVMQGKVTRDRQRLRVSNLTAQGLHGGLVRVSGTWERDAAGHRRLPHLTVQATGLPIDALLLASAPPETAQWMRRNQVAGRLDAQASITAAPDGSRQARLRVTLEEGSARPFGGPFALDAVSARAVVGGPHLVLERLHARHGRSELSLQGELLDLDGGPEMQLTATGTALRFEDPVADLLPPDQPLRRKLRELLERYRPTGLYDARWRCRISHDQVGSSELVLAPKELSFDLRGQRVALSEIAGKVTVTPEHVKLERCQFTTGGSQVGIDGTIVPGDAPAADVTLQATSAALEAGPHALYAPQLVQALEALELRGRYTLDRARLVLTPAAEGGANGRRGQDLRFEGQLTLQDVSALAGVPVTELSGKVEVSLEQRADEPRPRLDLRLRADSMRLAGRLLAPATLHLASSSDGRQLEIQSFRGACYGGAAAVWGTIELSRPERYRIRAVLDDVELPALLHPEAAASAAPAGAAAGDAAAPPRVSASLTVAGAADDPSSRRGRGELRVEGLQMRDTPLGTSLVQLLNLKWPRSQTFERVSAQYLLDGDRVHLKQVHFEGTGLGVIGGGRMSYRTHDLDLTLFTRNPNRSAWPPVADVLEMVKDELVTIVVSGTLENPVTKVDSLAGLRRSWEDVFGKPRPRQRPLPGGPSTSGQ